MYVYNIEERFLAEVFELKSCVACGKTETRMSIDTDHIKTKGSGGSDDDSNKWLLCRQDHTLKHNHGLNWLVKKYPRLRNILVDKGWKYDLVIGRWVYVKS